MTTIRPVPTPTAHSTAAEQPRNFVVVDGAAGLELVGPRRHHRLIARLRAGSLDDRLSAGEAPEASLLLAVRAAQLTSPAARRRLANDWDAVAERARHPHNRYDMRVPVARVQCHAAADQIHDVAELLRSGRPVSAQGVALATALLTTADSPAYQVGSRGDLAGAVARAVAAM